MRTNEEIRKLVKLTDTIRANQGQFWFTCENPEMNIRKEYAESEFDKVRVRFLESGKYPVQMFAHWEWKNGHEVFACSKLLHPEWVNFNTDSGRNDALYTIKRGLLHELAEQIIKRHPEVKQKYAVRSLNN